MKKRSFACLALALPVLAFAGCASAVSRLTLSANWYAMPNITTNITGTEESLLYTVTFESDGREDFSADYDEGSYAVRLTNTEITLADGSKAQGYRLTSELTITGRFTVNGETGEDFTDTVTSEALFLDVSHELQPVKSVKHVVTHSPVTTTPDSIDEACVAYEYTYTAAYDNDLTTADITVEYAQPEDMTDVQRTIKLSGDGSYLDNEVILFAMRGVSTADVSAFRTVNPVTLAQMSCSMSAAPALSTATMTFSVNGTSQERTMNTYAFSLGYTGSNAGQPQSLTYAAKAAEGENTYRNVLLQMDVPMLQSLGTFRYRLAEAVFNDK